MSLTEAQRAKMAQRLTLRHDRSDRGQLLPMTESALKLPARTTFEKAERAAAVALALVEERLVVPVPVEAHPHETGEHKPQGLGEDDEIPLPIVPGRYGVGVLAFSSARELAKWDPSARPMTMSAQRVAVAATQAGAPPFITIDVASDAPVVLPVGAVHALVGADQWLPPWKDASLAAVLRERVARECDAVVGLQVVPGDSTAEAGIWSGELEAHVLLAVERAATSQRERLANALAVLGNEPRLRTAAPMVSLVPKPVGTV